MKNYKKIFSEAFSQEELTKVIRPIANGDDGSSCPFCGQSDFWDAADCYDTYLDGDMYVEYYTFRCPHCKVRLNARTSSPIDIEFDYFYDDDNEVIDTDNFYIQQGNYAVRALSADEVDDYLSQAETVDLIGDESDEDYPEI